MTVTRRVADLSSVTVNSITLISSIKELVIRFDCSIKELVNGFDCSIILFGVIVIWYYFIFILFYSIVILLSSISILLSSIVLIVYLIVTVFIFSTYWWCYSATMTTTQTQSLSYYIPMINPTIVCLNCSSPIIMLS